MHDDFGVRFGLEDSAVRFEFLAKLAEILDDAVVYDGDARRYVRMGVALGRRAMRRPSGMPNAGISGDRLAGDAGFQIAEFSRRAPAFQPPAIDRSDARGIVAAIFEALQRPDQIFSNRFLAQNADDAAHAMSPVQTDWLKHVYVLR